MVTLTPVIWFNHVSVTLQYFPTIQYYLHIIVCHVGVFVSILWFQCETEHNDGYLPLEKVIDAHNVPN